MGQISDAITREYNSALERHQDSFSVGLKKVVDTFEKNKYIQISPENDPERRALTEAEEIAILRNEILRFLRSATGLASAGFAQKAEDERAIVDFLMAFFPKGLIEELMSEHLEWESKIRPGRKRGGLRTKTAPRSPIRSQEEPSLVGPESFEPCTNCRSTSAHQSSEGNFCIGCGKRRPSAKRLSPIKGSGTNKTKNRGSITNAGSNVRYFSSATALSNFSLQDQMASIGVHSIDDLYQRLSEMQSSPSVLTRLATSIASIPKDADLGRVLARLMFACSYVAGPHTTASAAHSFAALTIVGIKSPSDQIVARRAVTTVYAGIEAACKSREPLTCVNALQVISPIWCNDLPLGEKHIGGSHGRSWVAAVVINYLAELKVGTIDMMPAITESLQGGRVLSNTEHMRQMSKLGRSWAEARGIDYDEYIRRNG
jgi:hypothetical protein